MAWANRQGGGGDSVAALLGTSGAKLKAAMHAQIVSASKAAKLAGDEKVRKLFIDAEVWTVDNGMLTPTFKTKRVDLKKRYQRELDAMYAEGVSAGPSKL